MNLLVKIEEKAVNIVLKEGEKAVDSLDFPLDNELSMRLLPSIDEILKRNKLEAKDVSQAELETNLSDSFTTYRIAKAVVDAINWGKSYNT